MEMSSAEPDHSGSKIVAELISELESQTTSELKNETTLRIAFTFERFRIPNAKEMGWDNDIAVAHFQPEEISNLSGAVVSRLKKFPLDSSLVFALGKRYDRQLHPFWISLLREQLRIAPLSIAVGQTLIALSNLGEDTCDGHFSYDEFERNRTMAEKYLQNQGS